MLEMKEIWIFGGKFRKKKAFNETYSTRQNFENNWLNIEV